MAAAEIKLPDIMQNEIWRIMKRVAELGAYPENLQFYESNWHYECEGEIDYEDVDGDIDIDNPCEPHVENDILTDVAKKLQKAGDTYVEEQEKLEQEKLEQEKLVQDIVDYIRKKGDTIKVSPLDIMKSNDISQLENYIGDGESLSKIAIVSSITKGVSRGLKESSSQSVHLVAHLATKFISDKYGRYLMEKGGLIKLVMET